MAELYVHDVLMKTLSQLALYVLHVALAIRNLAPKPTRPSWQRSVASWRLPIAVRHVATSVLEAEAAMSEQGLCGAGTGEGIAVGGLMGGEGAHRPVTLPLKQSQIWA